MLLIIFCLITILFYLNYYQFLDVEIPNKSFLIFFMIILGLINYVFFIKDKKFMNYNFKTDKTGGYTIIGLVVLLALSFVFIANKNREKIFKERERARIENKQ
jgi:amino acid permease